MSSAEPSPVTDAMITPQTSGTGPQEGQTGAVCHVCQTANSARATYCWKCGVRLQPPPSAHPPRSTGGFSLEFPEYGLHEQPNPGSDPEWHEPPPEQVPDNYPRPIPQPWRWVTVVFVAVVALVLFVLIFLRSDDETPAVTTPTTVSDQQRVATEAYTTGLAGIAEEVASLEMDALRINQAWDNRSQSFEATRSGLTTIRIQTDDLLTQLDALQAPAELSLENRIRLGDSLRNLASAAQGMVNGLNSPDTGEARNQALDRFTAGVAEFQWFSNTVIEVLQSPPETQSTTTTS